MASHEDISDGIIASGKRVVGSFAALLRTRFELIVIEFQEEKVRALDFLTWFSVAMALTVAAVLLGVGTLALFLWQVAGYAGLIALTAGTFVAAGIVFLVTRRRLVHGPQPFSATLDEFKKDLTAWKGDQ